MKKNIRFAFVSNLITLFVSLVLFKPYFEETDDTFMAMIAEGAFGKRDAHVVFSHYILGLLEKGAQGVFTNVRMHSIIQYIFIFGGMLLVSYVLLQFKSGRIYVILFQMASFYEIYVALQFTKTAAFTAGCAIFALLVMLRRYCFSDVSGNKPDGEERVDYERVDAPHDRKSFWVVVAASLVIFTYGCMLRYEGAAIALCLMGSVGACTFVRCFISKKEKMHFVKPEDKKWTSYIKCAAVLLGIFAIVVVTMSSAYRKDGWAEYSDYNKARSLMVDNRCDAFDYTRNAATLGEAGVSENDALMYMTCMLPDPKEIGADEIRNIIAAQPPKRIDADLLKAWLMNLYESYFVLSGLTLGVIMLLGIVVIGAKKQYLPEYVVGIVTVAAMGAYFQYSGRWSHRLAYSLMLALLLAVLYLKTGLTDSVSTTKGACKKELAAVLMVILGFSMVGGWLSNRFEYNEYLRNKSAVDIDILKAHALENRDTLFCYDTFTLQDCFKYSVFRAEHEGDFANLVSCGNWLHESPVTKGQLSAFGYESPVEALKSKDAKVVLVDNCYPGQKALYLCEHSDEGEYSAVMKENVGGFDIYNIK